MQAPPLESVQQPQPVYRPRPRPVRQPNWGAMAAAIAIPLWIIAVITTISFACAIYVGYEAGKEMKAQQVEMRRQLDQLQRLGL